MKNGECFFCDSRWDREADVRGRRVPGDISGPGDLSAIEVKSELL